MIIKQFKMKNSADPKFVPILPASAAVLVGRSCTNGNKSLGGSFSKLSIINGPVLEQETEGAHVGCRRGRAQ